ncbi:AbrB/MazE/SpoVT family DNA-binding domain-containing protein [Candidatus Uhrbacteria bacterium]|nr:AbrB/MazE/SpoVT family DNA-binding domain-containing protein [Candidatus Uhrbacteria bacterium]
MAQTATITDKRQFTIPVEVYRKVGFREGEKVIVTNRGNKMIVEPAEKIISRIAGSVKLPRRFHGMSIDGMIRKAKDEHFSKKRA